MEERIQDSIKCFLFRESNGIIKNIILKLESAGPKEKQNYAQDILIEADSLLSCEKFTPDDPECIKCHSFAEVQKR